jgi:hypothetical protein
VIENHRNGICVSPSAAPDAGAEGLYARANSNLSACSLRDPRAPPCAHTRTRDRRGGLGSRRLFRDLAGQSSLVVQCRWCSPLTIYLTESFSTLKVSKCSGPKRCGSRRTTTGRLIQPAAQLRSHEFQFRTDRSHLPRRARLQMCNGQACRFAATIWQGAIGYEHLPADGLRSGNAAITIAASQRTDQQQHMYRLRKGAPHGRFIPQSW